MSLRQAKGVVRVIGEKGYEMVLKRDLRKDYLNAS